MSTIENFQAALATDSAFTGKLALDLAYLIEAQAEDVYVQRDIIFPVIASSTMLFMDSVASASLLEIAKVLGHPHQLVAQRIKALLNLKLLKAKGDAGDKRRTLYSLTPAGRIQAQRLKDYCSDASSVFSALSAELGVDLQHVLRNACANLKQIPLGKRIEALGRAI